MASAKLASARPWARKVQDRHRRTRIGQRKEGGEEDIEAQQGVEVIEDGAETMETGEERSTEDLKARLTLLSTTMKGLEVSDYCVGSFESL